MTNANLQHMLDELHQNLVDSPEIDPQTAQKLSSIMVDIQFALERTSNKHASVGANETITQRVQSLLTDFEVQHPKLVSNLSLIAERLADMGI